MALVAFAMTAEEKERLDQLKREHATLKHGPRGSGADGPCDPDCLKCSIEAELKVMLKVDEWT